ncbi:MAG: hypothetical protein ACAH59_08675 [Pseudobdellovibrionaceae bacterium]
MKCFSLFLLFLTPFLFPQWGFSQAPPKASEPLLYQPRPQVETVSEAVAQAGPFVVTSREVIISNILDEALALPIQSGALPDRKNWILKVKSEAYSKHLAQILLEIVVQLEAENFSIGTVSNEDVSSLEKHLEVQVKGWPAWKELEISSAEIQMLIKRKLRAKNFLKFKMESSGVQISDEEAKAFYDKNRVKFGSLPFSQFKGSIKEVLAQEQLQEKLKDWFEILKRKYRVRYLGQAG